MWNIPWRSQGEKEVDMTLIQVIKAFEAIASNQPSVNMIVQNDIFRLNACSDAKYGVFGWTQGIHSTGVDANTITYNFTFFYVDRLTEDRSNQIEVQSVGIETLDNIIRDMDAKGLYVDSNYTMQTFNQRFLDECAGVFCNVSISVPASSLCSESFADFARVDYNNDIMTY